jgi:hypothetical protein
MKTAALLTADSIVLSLSQRQVAPQRCLVWLHKKYGLYF